MCECVFVCVCMDMTSDLSVFSRSCLAVRLLADDISCCSNAVLDSGTSGNDASFPPGSDPQPSLLLSLMNSSTAAL